MARQLPLASTEKNNKGEKEIEIEVEKEKKIEIETETESKGTSALLFAKGVLA